mmetsp:Transcript_129213/g.234755  ORF Transcript_129213/g.234755 Transcript_129213/m.234755 type:complete len:360 (-) Transcript_129213:21-1100(-)
MPAWTQRAAAPSVEDEDNDLLDLLEKEDEAQNNAKDMMDMINSLTWEDLVQLAQDENSEDLELLGVTCKSQAECEFFGRWLTEECAFRSVDISQCTLSATYAGILSDAMCGNSKAKNFAMGGNDLGNDCCEAVAKLLKENKTLESVDLSGNEIKAEGGRTLAAGLKLNGGSLTLLDMGGNQLGDQGAKAFAEVLHSCHENFKHLDLLSNNITEAGAHYLAHAVEHCEHLEILRLDANVIRDTGALHFAAAIRHNPKTCKLTLCTNEITFVGKGYIDAASEAVGRPADMTDLDNNPTDLPPPPEPEVIRERKTLRKRCGLGLAYVFRAVRCGRRWRPLVPLAEQIDGGDVSPEDISGVRL